MTRKDLETAAGILEWSQRAPRCEACSELGLFHNSDWCDHDFIVNEFDEAAVEGRETAEFLAACVRLRAVFEELEANPHVRTAEARRRLRAALEKKER